MSRRACREHGQETAESQTGRLAGVSFETRELAISWAYKERHTIKVLEGEGSPTADTRVL